MWLAAPPPTLGWVEAAEVCMLDVEIGLGPDVSREMEEAGAQVIIECAESLSAFALAIAVYRTMRRQAELELRASQEDPEPPAGATPG